MYRSASITSYPCTSTRDPMYIAKLSLLIVNLFLVSLFFYFTFLYFDALLGRACKVTISMLVYTSFFLQNMWHKIWFEEGERASERCKKDRPCVWQIVRRGECQRCSRQKEGERRSKMRDEGRMKERREGGMKSAGVRQGHFVKKGGHEKEWKMERAAHMGEWRFMWAWQSLRGMLGEWSLHFWIYSNRWQASLI